jgi:hypothetical protein
LNAPLLATTALGDGRRAPCLIVNPKSFRAARGGLAARAVALGKASGAEVIETGDPAALLGGVEAQLARGQQRFFVLAGDGTVQALVDHLARRARHLPMPELLVLGGGRSNLIAADVEGCGAVLDKLAAALAQDRAGHAFAIQTRPVLAIEQAPAPARHGFFVAGGLIDAGIRYCHAYQRQARGWFSRGHLSTLAILIRLAVLGLIGRSPLRSPPMDTDAGALGRLRAPTSVFVAATLEHARGLFDPYAARGQGPLRLTAIDANAPRFWRSLPGILLGRFGPHLNLAQGYLSGRCEAAQVLGMSGYTLDGEEFDADPARPVTIRTGAHMRFIRL